MATPTEYDFNQEVYSITFLTSKITAAGLSTALQGIVVTGSMPYEIIAITFVDVLSAGDVINLNTMMSSYQAVAVAAINHAVSVIGTSIQTEANLIKLLTTKVTQTLPTLSYDQLSQAMTVLSLT